MAYMWNDFNIKPMRAETIVYRDGVYLRELSTINNGPINKNYDLPVHIIYVGEIAGENTLNIEINVPNQPVFLSVNITNKKPAFFNILVKNAGKNSELRGHVMMTNFSELNYNCNARHTASDTTILVKNKLVAEKESLSKMIATAIIGRNCEKCNSDIGFTALADKTAKITFSPTQRISSVPTAADHGAAIYAPNAQQILYLRQSGLAGAEVDVAMREAFMNDFGLF